MIRYITFAEYLWLAEQVTGIEADTIKRFEKIYLADSALNAPQTSFGGVEKYPDLIDKASVLACRLAWNHALPDGNKRSSWASLVMFLDLNGIEFIEGQPNANESETVMLSVASREMDEEQFAHWLRARTRIQQS